ncbi:hypothetical protein [Microbacterium hydrocarbonoxydans]|uniref:Large exoprotein n=1 Tax=Microbacterium hydrocarbonoxydans TaxID=273678 RepID=A0A1H4K5G9_9MICO|nr:hypothetical protein [Microbacterium hydrocarbonoxydans]SEB53774.1 hypothetical protein SAMN04489807_1241 [Microbacterium hydrocarbonoxydans]
MDGPVLSGGVIVLVAVLLWMLYLLPSWRGRFQYDAAERNAVRLNQALRVLAETSETPGEVRLELTARTALAQQKLAKRVQSEKEAAELALLREQLAATRADPAVRQARARRRVRIVATSALLLGVALAGLGVWQLIATQTQLLLWAGGSVMLASALVLQRMSSVAARAARRSVRTVEQPVTREQPPLHDQGRATWTPRPLPEPLVSVTGSRAQAARAEMDAQEQRRSAARLAELRERAERMAPPAPVQMPTTPVTPAEKPAAASPFARMGYVDDAEIEAHVRDLLAKRAAG